MFQTDDYQVPKDVIENYNKVQRNYILKENDVIEIRVETNKGEALVDPNFQMRSELGVQNLNAQNQNFRPSYLIRADGMINLPLIGNINLAGKTLYQADSTLMKAYQDFYKDPFVVTSITNRRVIVFNGQIGQVIPLPNENTSLIEILAQAGGIQNFNKAHNIRLIRGELNNPYVEVIDLSTIEGMKRANLQAQHMDVIYVEPVRRVVVEAARDLSPIFSLVTSVITLIIVAGL